MGKKETTLPNGSTEISSREMFVEGAQAGGETFAATGDAPKGTATWNINRV